MKKKVKVIVLAGLCALGLCAWASQVVNPAIPSVITMEDNVPTGYEVIVLQGSLILNVGPNAIVAGASDNDIYIGFNRSFGYVSISIYNSMGSIVYNTVVNTDVQQVVIIPFTNANGSYIVELSNARGYADGDFERE